MIDQLGRLRLRRLLRGIAYREGMSVTASDVARQLRAELPDINVTTLHKLLYFCQGHHLADTGAPLFPDTISCWDRGPVVGKLWKAEKDHQALPPSRALDSAALQTVGYVVSRYGRLSAKELSALSHRQDPWRDADSRRPPGGHARIDQTAIKAFFVDQAARERTGVSEAAIQDFVAGAETRRLEPARVDDPDHLRARFLHMQ